jgi:hypothetical protein
MIEALDYIFIVTFFCLLILALFKFVEKTGYKKGNYDNKKGKDME